MSDALIKFDRKSTTVWALIVILAVGFVALGLFFAIKQTRQLGRLLINDAHKDAARYRTNAIGRVGDESRRTLNELIRSYRQGARRGMDATFTDPEWLTDLCIIAGGQIFPTTEADPGVARLMHAELQAFSYVNPPPGFEWEPERILIKTDRGKILLTFLTSQTQTGRTILAAGRIDMDVLLSSLIQPILNESGKLAAVPLQDAAEAPWHESIGQEFVPWVIIPSPRFLQSQERAVVLQIALYVGGGTLFLVTLLVLVRKFLKLVDHEVALSQMKSSFVAGVSHELKTPLALIRMFIETLKEGRVPNEEKRNEYYEIIARESQRLTHLIQNILDFSRIEAGKKQYSFDPINVGDIVSKIYNDYRHDLERQGFEHSLNIDPELSNIHADSHGIAQIVVNLLSNAIKYSRDEKRVRIEVANETRRDKHGVLISVLDSGIGIRPEDRGKLFEGFFRADDERVRDRGGTGLGLALVKHIVDAHGGSVDVESRLVKGSTFRVFLPDRELDGDEPLDEYSI